MDKAGWGHCVCTETGAGLAGPIPSSAGLSGGKKVRDDKGYWEQVDVYLHKHSSVDVSHGICPECMKKHYPDEYRALLPGRVISKKGPFRQLRGIFY